MAASMKAVTETGIELSNEERNLLSVAYKVRIHSRAAYSGSGQGCGSGFELLDPDPHLESRSGSRRAKITHKYRKSKKYHVLKCWMFSFEG
jgi:hypothetical protein